MMKKNTSLSIIVPAYNMQEFITECLESILCQLTLSHELIVVNDGSTDTTLAIITKLQNGYGKDNFHIINQNNQGLSDARNNAIEIASGEYIVLIDGDDVLLPHSLELLDNTIQAYHPDVIACDYRVWFPDKKIDTTLSYPPNQLIVDKELILTTFFADRNMGACTKVFKKSLYQQLGRIFPSGQLFEELTAVPQLLACCQNLIYLPHLLIDYRQRPASITKSITERNCLEHLAALFSVKNCLQEKQVSENIKLHFDIFVCFIYFETIKRAYQLPGKLNNEVRAKLKTIFFNNLCNDYRNVLLAMEQNTTLREHNLNVKTANRIRLILKEYKLFHYRRLIAGKRQRWKVIYNTWKFPLFK